MVSIFGLVAFLLGAALLYIAITESTCEGEEKTKMSRIAICVMLAGAGVILVNAWIIKPIMIVLGG